MEQADKIREIRLRHAAWRRGYKLERSRARDPREVVVGDPQFGVVIRWKIDFDRRLEFDPVVAAKFESAMSIQQDVGPAPYDNRIAIAFAYQRGFEVADLVGAQRGRKALKFRINHDLARFHYFSGAR